MTAEQIEGLIKFSIAIVAPIAGSVIWLIKREERLQENKKLDMQASIAIAKENSAGAAAILELIEKDKEIHEEIEELKNNIEKKDQARAEEIRRLAQNITDFTFEAIKFLGGNINKNKN